MRSLQGRRPLAAVLLAAAALQLAVAPGCVRRRLTVRTEPPGAMVYVDRRPIGLSPVSTRFTYYGTRHFEIVKDGHRTEKFLRRFNPPWYELPVIAFFSETLYPFELRDERLVDVQLSAEPEVPTEAIIASGQELRDQSRMGLAVPPPSAAATLPPVEAISPLPAP